MEGSSSNGDLELRLGPPGEEWRNNGDHVLVGYYSNGNQKNHQQSVSGVWYNQNQSQQGKGTINCQFLQFQSNKLAVAASQQTLSKQSLQPCCTKAVIDLQQPAEKVFSQPHTAVPNTSPKRSAPGPVVGWPPIRSSRKKLASRSSNSAKSAIASQNETPNKKVAGEKPAETCNKGMFVKINMDGVPIGRKIDLKAYDSYDKLSSAVDELFRGLLAAQGDSSIMKKKKEEEKAITGVLDGSGEYTLVYEDNEGDRMLVGDVPWHMFVSTVKRLRVLKSSEVSALTVGSSRSEKC